LPLKPYSRKEIEAFVAVNLRVAGEKALAEIDRLQARFADTIETLPAWQQILLVESRADNIVGDEAAVADLYAQTGAEKKKVLGFFQKGDLSLSFNTESAKVWARNPIVWDMNARDELGVVTARHEDGHRIDALLATEGAHWYSAASPAWKTALARDLSPESIAARMRAAPATESRNPLRWVMAKMRGTIEKEWAPLENLPAAGQPLYEGYRELSHHIALYKQDGQHPLEAFAEMSNHYATLFTRYGGNENVVDFLLQQRYPALWAHYRDEVIPRAEKMAQAMMAQREQAIGAYMKSSRALHDIAQKPFDAEETQRNAGLMAARGVLHKARQQLSLLRAVYEDPVTYYVDELKELEQARWDIATDDRTKYRQPFVFDRADAEARARQILAAEGPDGIARDFLSLQEEKKVLEKYAQRERAFALSTQQIYYDERKRLQGVFPHDEVLARYDRLKDEGGFDAVRAYAAMLPSKAVAEKYISARMILHEERTVMEKDGARVPPLTDKDYAAFAADLRSLCEQGGQALAVQTTEALNEQRKALSAFVSRMNRAAEALGYALGTEPPYDRESDMLAAFDRMMAEGGIAAVEDFKQRVTIGNTVARAYVMAREEEIAARLQIAKDGGDISWSRRAGLYRPFAAAVGELPADFNRKVALEIQDLLMNGGQDAVIAATEKLRVETHEKIAAALGKPATLSLRTAPPTGSDI
jgi:hypothetical protein